MLEVENLTVAYTHHGKMVKALQNVSFHIHKGETYGLVGESGAGKTTLALSLLRCHTHGLVMEQGSIRFKHQELFELSSRELRSLWGKELAFMPQDALAALNPSLRIGEQIEEVLRYQLGLNRQEAKQSALDWLGKVQLTDMLHIADSYPHQLSGGMQQRVMLAMVLAARPSLLILDEPTTNLDLTTQAALLSLLKRLFNEQHITTLYISHNLKVIANFCTRVGVLFSGELVEEGETKALFASPYHPYTQGLLASSPLLGVSIQQQRLTPMLPGKAGEQNGCSFFARCALAEVSCYQHPIMKEVSPARKVRCPHWQEITAIDKKLPKLNATQPGSGRDSGLLPLLKVERFSVEYPSPNRFPFINQLKHKPRRALTEITLEAYRGRTLGIVGESGSGKTTLARAIMGLIQENTCKNPAQRLQLWAQQDYIVLPQQSKQRESTILRCLQMVFQNSDETLNPYLTVGEMLQRPFMRLLHQPAEEAMQNSRAMLQSVMLPEGYATRYPHQLSGGEKQRVAIARAIVSMPLMLICDEAVSALDNTVQAFILNLLHDLRESYHFSLLLISHDLAIISYLADEIVVMLQGYVVERSARESFFSFPHHPYTATAVEKVFMDDVVPSNMQQTQNLALPDGGCFYAAQCARKVEVEKGLSSSALCTSHKPPWVEAAQANKHIYCHYPVE